jgi:hypothetical protein
MGSAPDEDVNATIVCIFTYSFRNKLVMWADGVGERKRR